MSFDDDNKTTTASFVSLGQIKLDKGESVNTDDLPIIPTRNLVLFPEVTIPIGLKRDNSLITAQLSSERNLPVGILCQSNPKIDNPRFPDDFYEYGVVAKVIKVFELPDGSHTALLHAHTKFKVLGPGAGSLLPEAKYSAQVKLVKDSKPRSTDTEFATLCSQIREQTLEILQNTTGAPDEFVNTIKEINDPVMLVNVIATHLPLEPEKRKQCSPRAK